MKLLIIRSKKSSSWTSCKVISTNLHQLYKKLSDSGKCQINWFDIDEDYIQHDLESKNLILIELAELIKYIRPDHLVFVDHLPAPCQILNILSTLLKNFEFPNIVIHLYGDFSYFANDWHHLNNFFDYQKITFIAASEAQKKLVSDLLIQPQSVEKLCFPINEENFYYDPELRNNTRNQFQLSDKDFVITYTGRISLQKNIDLLIKEFSILCNNYPDKSFYLWIIGPFDDIGANFLGMEALSGMMFHKIQETLSAIEDHVRSKIKFFGMVSSLELQQYLQATDLFASFSLYHDEDFGMSPAEALATGSPTCLTNWGGYSSFYSPDLWECKIIPVKITESGHEISVNKFHEYIKYLIHNTKQIEEGRQHRSKQFAKFFGINGNIQELFQILKSKSTNVFIGFNWKLRDLARIFINHPTNIKINEDLIPQNSNFYFQIYNNYIDQNIEPNHE